MISISQVSKWQVAQLSLSLAILGALILVSWQLSENSQRDSGGAISPSVMKNRIFAEVRILRRAPYLVFDDQHAESKEEFEIYRQTQARMVKGQFVLNAVLRDPEISRSNLLKDEPHPMRYLEEHLEVDFPASEFMRISFAGETSRDVAVIINSVVREYINEVANSENDARNKRISELDKAHREIEEHLRARKSTLKRLVKNLQTGDSVMLTEKQKMMMELLAVIRNERARLHLELMNARIKLAAIAETGDIPDEPVIPEATVETRIAEKPQVQQLELKIAVLEQELAESEARSGDDPELKGRLAAFEKTLETLKSKLRPAIVKQLQAAAVAQPQAERAALAETVRVIEMTIKELDDQLDRHQLEPTRTGEWSLEVEQLKDDLIQAKEIDQRLTTEIEHLKIELKAESRVHKYREAEAF